MTPLSNDIWLRGLRPDYYYYYYDDCYYYDYNYYDYYWCNDAGDAVGDAVTIWRSMRSTSIS